MQIISKIVELLSLVPPEVVSKKTMLSELYIFFVCDDL